MSVQALSHRRKRRRRPLLLPAACLLFLLLGVILGRWSMASATPAAAGSAPSTPPAAAENGDGPAGQNMEPGAGDIHSGPLILVSNSCPYVFPEEQPLVNVLEGKSDKYFVRDSTVELAPETMEALNGLLADFAAQGGPKRINVVAGYRTEAFQQYLFDQSAAANGLEHARRYVSQPGGSEHHTGYALDLALYYPDSGASGTFDGTGACQWIADHAAEYGFVLRYPAGKEIVTGIAAESWHYRYVGLPHAPLMVEHGFCLEEYLAFLREYPCDGPHLQTTWAGQAYEIYCCDADALFVPTDAAYTLSGDNQARYIVTVWR